MKAFVTLVCLPSMWFWYAVDCLASRYQVIAGGVVCANNVSHFAFQTAASPMLVSALALWCCVVGQLAFVSSRYRTIMVNYGCYSAPQVGLPTETTENDNARVIEDNTW